MCYITQSSRHPTVVLILHNTTALQKISSLFLHFTYIPGSRRSKDNVSEKISKKKSDTEASKSKKKSGDTETSKSKKKSDTETSKKKSDTETSNMKSDNTTTSNKKKDD